MVFCKFLRFHCFLSLSHKEWFYLQFEFNNYWVLLMRMLWFVSWWKGKFIGVCNLFYGISFVEISTINFCYSMMTCYQICSRILNARGEDRSFEKLFVMKDSSCNESASQLFVDTAVYSRNRCFRLFLSSKAGKSSVLLPTERFKCKNLVWYFLI